MKAENKRCCRHYREGLPYCAECAKDEAERNEALHAQIAELKAELAEARAEINIIEHDANVLIGDIKAELERKDKLIEQMRETPRLALAEIAVLKAALWYFGNSLGPDVAEELENALPERLSRKINLTEIENTNGEAVLEAAERGEG